MDKVPVIGEVCGEEVERVRAALREGARSLKSTCITPNKAIGCTRSCNGRVTALIWGFGPRSSPGFAFWAAPRP